MSAEHSLSRHRVDEKAHRTPHSTTPARKAVPVCALQSLGGTADGAGPAAGTPNHRSWRRSHHRHHHAQQPVQVARPDFASLLPMFKHPGELDAGAAASAAQRLPAAITAQAAAMGPRLPASALSRHSFSLVCACNMNRCVATIVSSEWSAMMS